MVDIRNKMTEKNSFRMRLLRELAYHCIFALLIGVAMLFIPYSQGDRFLMYCPLLMAGVLAIVLGICYFRIVRNWGSRGKMKRFLKFLKEDFCFVYWLIFLGFLLLRFYLEI